MEVAGSTSPTASQLPQLEALCWPRSPCRKLFYIVVSLIKEANDKRFGDLFLSIPANDNDDAIPYQPPLTTVIINSQISFK